MKLLHLLRMNQSYKYSTSDLYKRLLVYIFQVPVQMMNKQKRFDTYYDQAINTSVLHLPFNSSYSMLLLLPDDMATLENAICPNHVAKWLRWMKSRLEES